MVRELPDVRLYFHELPKVVEKVCPINTSPVSISGHSMVAMEL